MAPAERRPPMSRMPGPRTPGQRPSRPGFLAATILLLVGMAIAPGCGRDRGPAERGPPPIGGPGADRGPAERGPPPIGAPGAAAASVELRAFDCTLVDGSKTSGIDFLHVVGGYGEKLLPETMGSGCAILDFDGDSRLDLFFVNGCFWPGHEPPGKPQPTCALYRGRGDGTFEDVTLETGAGITIYGMGSSVADFDADGDDDIFVTGTGKNVLLRNDAGRFADATDAAGVAVRTWTDREGRQRPEWSTASGWADVDIDGDVDLIVGNYIEWSMDYEVFTTLDGMSKAFTTPDRYRGLPCRLFLNRGDGTFEEGTERAGLLEHRGKALGLAFWDFDGNGLLDFAVANDTRPNFLFMNRGGGKFDEIGLPSGIAYDETGRARAGMGMDIADYDNGGVPSIVVSNFSDEPISLYRWREDGAFTSEENRAGIAQPTYSSLAFGILFLDVDLDGVQDLVIANGHIEPDINRFMGHQSYPQAPQIFQGRSYGRFEDLSTRVGPDFMVPRVGRGLAAGDLDGDGDLDLVMTVREGKPVVFQNRRGLDAPNHHLRVRLHGKGKNTRALGAYVRITAGGVTQTRLARTASSYLSQSEQALTFGLGRNTKVERLRVRWPSGTEVEVPVDGVDRTLDIRE